MNPDSTTIYQTDSALQPPTELPLDTLYGVMPYDAQQKPEEFVVLSKTDSIPSICSYQSDSLLTNEVRIGLSGKEMPVSATANAWVVLLMLLTFMFVAASYKRGEKYLTHIFNSIFKHKDRNSLFDDTTINEAQLRASLLLLTFVAEGLAIYHGLLQPIVNTQTAIFPAVLLCVTLCGIHYFLQRGIYTLLGNVFSDNAKAQKFNEGFISVNLVLGLFLSPIILLIMFIPEMTHIGLCISIIFYLIARLTIVYKGVRIFSPGVFGLLYIILYLCALEIVPIFLMGKTISTVYRIVELNFLLP